MILDGRDFGEQKKNLVETFFSGSIYEKGLGGLNREWGLNREGLDISGGKKVKVLWRENLPKHLTFCVGSVQKIQKLLLLEAKNSKKYEISSAKSVFSG